MHTISMLRRTLGLSSDNQVRNRIERIKDLLSEHMRRGPNNQIFLTNPGLDLLKQLQDLYDTGLTLAEASQVLRTTSEHKPIISHPVSSRLASDGLKPSQSTPDLSPALQEELLLIRKHITSLENKLASASTSKQDSAEDRPWWTYLREDVDVT